MHLAFILLRRRPLPRLIFAFLLNVASWGAVVPRESSAADYHWNNPQAGEFGDAANWTPHGVPTLGDTAIFDLGSAGHTVLFPAPPTPIEFAYLRINQDAVTTDLRGNTVLLTGANAPLISLGNSATDVANWTLQNGEVNSTGGAGQDSIAYAIGSTASVTLDGSVAAWHDTQLTVGEGGVGTLTVKNAAQFATQTLALASTTGSQGTVTVAGSDSLIAVGPQSVGQLGTGALTIGDAGKGEMFITTAGKLLAPTATVTAGNQAGADGSISISGSGSELVAASLVLGNKGNGSLTISAGATATLAAVTISASADAKSSVKLDGGESRLDSGDRLSVGATGSATFAQTAAATASANNVYIGGGVSGVYTLDGAGTQLTALKSINVDGNGELTLSAGATASTPALRVGRAGNSTGTVTLSGSETALSGGDVELGTQAGSPTASLTVKTAATFTANSLTMDSGDFTLDGGSTTATVAQATTINAGSLSIKHAAIYTAEGYSWVGEDASLSPAVVYVDGDGSQWNASGLTVGTNGLLEVTTGGAVTSSAGIEIAGSLSVSGSSQVNTPWMQIEPTASVDLSGGGIVNIGPLASGATERAFSLVADPATAAVLNVEPGGVLHGAGSILGSLVNSGGAISVAPTDYADTFKIQGDFTQTALGSLSMSLVGAPYNSVRTMEVAGNVALSGTLTLNFLFADRFPLHVGQQYNLISAARAFTIEQLGISVLDAPERFQYSTQLLDGVYSLTVTAVPEPATWLLALAGVLLLTLWARR